MFTQMVVVVGPTVVVVVGPPICTVQGVPPEYPHGIVDVVDAAVVVVVGPPGTPPPIAIDHVRLISE